MLDIFPGKYKKNPFIRTGFVIHNKIKNVTLIKI